MPSQTVLVEPIRAYRELMTATLKGQLGADSVSVVPPEEVMDCINDKRADVVLLRIDDPRYSEYLGAIRDAGLHVKIVAIGVTESNDVIISLAEGGVDGYVSRESDFAEVLVAIRNAREGEIACSPRVVAALFKHMASLGAVRAERSRFPTLTTREREIVWLIDRGFSNKEIARHLTIQKNTVKNHIHHILEKLDVKRRGEAAPRLRALEGGMAKAIGLVPRSI